MARFDSNVAAALCLPLICAVASAQQPPPSIPEQLDDMFRRYEAHGFAGAVRVISGNQPLLDAGYGLADLNARVPATPQTVYGIGSISKQFTAAAILVLQQQGELRTTDAIGTYLDFGPKWMGQITIHHLLTHTSGLPDAYWDLHPDLSRDEYLRHIADGLERDAVPGARHRYSNYGYDLLGKVIEVASGLEYETFLEEHLFDPVGMRSTGYAIPHFDPDLLARYNDPVTEKWTRRGIVVSNPLERPPSFAPIGSGGLLSTVGDLHAWHVALLGADILTASSKERLFTPVADGYAYGWRIMPLPDGARVIFHGGYDDSLGLAAGLYRLPAHGALIVILSNTIINEQFRADSAAMNVFRIMMGEPVVLPPRGIEVPPEQLAAWVGRYTLPNGDTIAIERQDAGLIVVARGVEPVQMLTFPEAYAAEPSPLDERLATVIAGMDAGDFAPLQSALWESASFEHYRDRWSDWWTDRVEELGAYRAVGQVHQLTTIADRGPEVQTYVALRFERGVRILRVLQNMDGRLFLDIPPRNEHLRMRLAPQSRSSFRGWLFKLQTGPHVEFHPDRIEISSGGDATIIGRRVR